MGVTVSVSSSVPVCRCFCFVCFGLTRFLARALKARSRGGRRRLRCPSLVPFCFFLVSVLLGLSQSRSLVHPMVVFLDFCLVVVVAVAVAQVLAHWQLFCVCSRHRCLGCQSASGKPTWSSVFCRWLYCTCMCGRVGQGW